MPVGCQGEAEKPPSDQKHECRFRDPGGRGEPMVYLFVLFELSFDMVASANGKDADTRQGHGHAEGNRDDHQDRC